MSDFTIITNKPEYIFAVSGIVVKFIGTEIEVKEYCREYHYEDAVQIVINHSVVGVVYHKRDQSLLSLDFLTKEKHQAILDAHEEFLKCLESDNRMHNPFDKEVEDTIREFVLKHGKRGQAPYDGSPLSSKEYSWKPCHCDQSIINATVMVDEKSQAMEVIIQYWNRSLAIDDSPIKISNPVINITSDGRKIRQHGETNKIDWRTEFGLL